jgi:hypothetical protein
MIRELKYISVAAIGALALGGTPVRAQQQPADPQQEQQPANPQQEQQPGAPIPAIRSPLASATDNGDQEETPSAQQLTPDTRSLTGAEDLSLGSPAVRHSYWLPRVSLFTTVDSNPNYSTTSSDWSTWTSLVGGVDIERTSGVSDLLVRYTGGGMFSNGGSVENGVIQLLGFRDRFSFRRSTFTVFEQLGYLPESSFGFAGTGVELPGVGGSIGLGNIFAPIGSILAPRGQNLNSATAAEFDYRLTPRASLNIVGGYVLLRYFENGLANYGDAIFEAGYDYQLTPKDTIAVSYLFSGYRFGNLDQSINSSTIYGSYGRRITGRLAFQIAAGPQFVSSTSPITSSVSSSSSTTSSTSTVYWALNSSLRYQLRRASLSARYFHGLTGGSGLLTGAESNIVDGSVSGQVSRAFLATWHVGYSRNSGHSFALPSTEQTYSYWFTGGDVSHPIGRSLDIFLNYQLQYQTNNSTACVGTGCSANLIRNQIAFGFNLHKQPIPF